ncbi:molybdate ABC transporter permease subunit [Thaumasiovibrio sp. DFM-14]|uniref:molybdate ABC transporter permease subunit n=1 Tax=Thaumasiovibrio sp. DFM-14 TaxID=3384792 RepID=UPI00399FBFD3
MILSPFEINAIYLSLKVSAAAIIGSFPIALLLAWVLARYQFRGKSVLNSVIHLPLVVPPVVIGYLLLVTMGQQGAIGRWLYMWFGMTFSFNWKGAALASAVVSLPLMVRALRSGFESVDAKLEVAAQTLGAKPWRVFVTITLPLCYPAIISAVILGFSRALGEFGATITFVASIPGQTQTIPLAIYQYLEVPGSEWEALRLCVVSVLFAYLAVALSEYFQRIQEKRP